MEPFTTPGIFDEEDYCPRCKDFHKTSSCVKNTKVYPKLEKVIEKIEKKLKKEGKLYKNPQKI